MFIVTHLRLLLTHTSLVHLEVSLTVCPGSSWLLVFLNYILNFVMSLFW